MSQENKFVTMMHANDLKCDKTSTTMMCNKVLARNIDVDKLEEDYNYMFYASSRNETIKNTLILSNDFADMY